jgi:hypothetical protein
MRRSAIIVAIITALGVVVAALISIYPSIRDKNRTTDIAIAGIVVDQDTNRGIGQAKIVVAGRAEEYVTEDTGNFRIDLRADTPKRLRLHVSKNGFQPLDTSVEPPAESLVLQLRKQ